MNNRTTKILLWTPRIITIIFALFISLFALDSFGAGNGFWKSIAAFLIHLIPTYLVVIVLILAWRRPWIGAVAYIGLGIFYIVWAWGRFHISAYFGISGPLFLIGGLFLISWYYRLALSGNKYADQ
ncbi:MAG: hypothetical protein ABIA75_09160 [Candidatus Neomarinimicrobiota bacterium]